MQKTGRNDPCPCGSGKKYKKCCLAGSYSPPGREKSILSKLINDLLAFARKRYGDSIGLAYNYFWDEFDPEEHIDDYSLLNMADLNFWEWLIFDWMPEKDENRTLIDFYMEEGRRLSAVDKEILSRMKDSVISLYEVVEVFPGKGLLLRDLVFGGEYDVREKAATMSLRKWDIIATRLLHIDDSMIMSGCIYPYHRDAREVIITHLKKFYKEFRKAFPEADMKAFLKWNGDLFNYYWHGNIRQPFMPELMTMDGEPMVFARSHFSIEDRESVIEGLRNIGELEENGDIFEWLDERKDDGPASILGRIRLKNDSLTLESNSRERIERGKRLLIDSLGDMIDHKADTIQDPYQAMKDMPEPREKTESSIPMEVRQEIYTRFMRDHYEKWLNEKIPALGGNTPFEMIKMPGGKEKVAELLKDIENDEEHKKLRGEPWFDVSWMWERLGIER